MQPRRLIPVVPAAWRYAAPLAVVGALGIAVAWAWGVVWLWVAAAIFLLLAAYVLYFFRDPERKSPKIPGAIVSPADGKVVSVEEVPDARFPGGRARRIAIFLSIFDVHVQRAPVQAVTETVEHLPGKFLNALNDKCSEDNEHTSILMRHGTMPIAVRQIAGAIARRIICSVQPGDHVETGDRIGLICFGSRVEAFLPLDSDIRVKPGLRVRGGESVLALLPEQNPLKNGNAH